MDVDQAPSRQQVDSFIIALAQRLRAIGPNKSAEGAVAAAVSALGDRLHRSIGPDDIARLAEEMQTNAMADYEAVLMRAKFALPLDRQKRDHHWGES